MRRFFLRRNARGLQISHARYKVIRYPDFNCVGKHRGCMPKPFGYMRNPKRGFFAPKKVIKSFFGK
jgi:hypothetical protein